MTITGACILDGREEGDSNERQGSESYLVEVSWIFARSSPSRDGNFLGIIEII